MNYTMGAGGTIYDKTGLVRGQAQNPEDQALFAASPLLLKACREHCCDRCGQAVSEKRDLVLVKAFGGNCIGCADMREAVALAGAQPQPTPAKLARNLAIIFVAAVTWGVIWLTWVL